MKFESEIGYEES